jgi:hypothetical protein
MPFSLAEPSVSQSTPKINPEMIQDTRNSKSKRHSLAENRIPSRNLDTAGHDTNPKAKRPGSLFEPGRCELTNVIALESLL